MPVVLTEARVTPKPPHYTINACCTNKHGRDHSFFARLTLQDQNTYIQCYAEGLLANVIVFGAFMEWLHLDEVIRGSTRIYWDEYLCEKPQPEYSISAYT